MKEGFDYKVPFLDYYKKNNCIPVGQDISDLSKHFSRRDGLYRSLGIPSFSIQGKKVLELGPGTGHNAIFTNSCKPSDYFLVDGNEISIDKSRRNIEKYFTDTSNCKFICSTLEELCLNEKFDFVFCEGVVPGQYEPDKFIVKLAEFLKPGGILTFTCVDEVSSLSEITRRIIALQLIRYHGATSEDDKLSLLKPYYEKHFLSLKGASRLVDDWIKDALLVPLLGELYSIESAIECLSNDFEILATNPSFIIDWRWYKDVFLESRDYNKNGIAQFRKNLLNFLDYRYEFGEIEEKDANKLRGWSKDLYAQLQKVQKGEFDISIRSCIGILANISDLLSVYSSETSRSVKLHMDTMDAIYNDRNIHVLDEFMNCDWFGRVQQYVSFTKSI